jgi:hypothetical protein
MIKNYISLTFGILIQAILIRSIFNNVKLDITKENAVVTKLIIHIFEIGLIMGISYFMMKHFLTGLIDNVSLIFVIIFVEILLVIIWLYAVINDYINKLLYGLSNMFTPFNYNNNNNNINDINLTTAVINDDVIFSKYHSKNNIDFTFENAYPDYNKIKNTQNEVNNNTDREKDYSAFDGYAPGHICYKCSCLTDSDTGHTFCGKQIDGVGTIGCSSRWECRNCKDCKEPSNTAPAVRERDDYNCSRCKCVQTVGGKICGKVSRIDGYVKKCSSECSKCDKCYGEKTNDGNNKSVFNSNNLVVVPPESNLNKVIINNIKNSDLNNVIN